MLLKKFVFNVKTWFLSIFAVLFLIIIQPVFSQDESRPWERLGLSQTEWRLIGENNISMAKLEQIMKAGIGVAEYIQKPWVALELSEEKWVKKRRSGLTSYDIELEAKRDTKEWKSDLSNDASKDLKSLSENGELFSSLFLPGYFQYHIGQKRKSAFMVGFAGGALVWFTVGSIANKRFEVAPIALIIVPDMVWSFIDYKITKKNERAR